MKKLNNSFKKIESAILWRIGGGQLNTMFLNERLVDGLHIFMMPIVLSDGIELFKQLSKETALTLKVSKTYPTAVVELRYALA